VKPSIAKVVGLPVVVIHHESPLSWRAAKGKAKPEPDPDGSTSYVGSSPDIPFVEWKKGIMLPANSPAPRSFDGYEVREHFMSLRTPQDCLVFLNKYGRFSPLQKIDEQVGWTFKAMMKWQEVFADLAKRSPDKWSDYANSLMSPEHGPNIRGVVGALSWSKNSITFQKNSSDIPTAKGAKYFGVIATNDVVSAIVTTLQVDHVRGAKFGVCARIDCPRFYEITSHHKRKYCGETCAHLETVRRLRKRQKARSKPRTKGRAVS
jgi:hypothetical protein